MHAFSSGVIQAMSSFTAHPPEADLSLTTSQLTGAETTTYLSVQLASLAFGHP